MHELISAATNSCNQTINVANISGRAISSAFYIYCIDQLILTFAQCKHNFLGFTILRIHDYDPELGTPGAHVKVFVLLYVNVVMLHVFLEFGLGRAHTYFTGRVFPRCRRKLHYFFVKLSKNSDQFFRDFSKNSRN